MKCISPRGWAIALAAIGLSLSAQPAKAGYIVSVSGGDRAASADFTVTGNQLTIVLTNTASADVTQATRLLTGVFFNITTSPSMTASSAFVAPGSSILNSGMMTPPPGWTPGDVGGEFAFRGTTFTIGSTSYGYGLSSTGLGIFGATINDNTLYPPDGPDGPDFGITSASTTVDDIDDTGATNRPQINNAVLFTLNLAPGHGLTTSNIGDFIGAVRFQYGTALNEGNLDGGGGGGNAVPAPAGLLLLATAVPVFALRRLIRRKTAAA